MNVDSKDNIESFYLQIIPLCESPIYLYDINSQHIIYMVKTVVTELVCLRKEQQRLFLLTTIFDDDRSMVSCNIDNYSITMVVEIPSGGERTRRTAVLKVTDNSEVYLDNTDESNEYDRRIGEYPHYNESGTYGSNCDN